jgi:hypothetical protein
MAIKYRRVSGGPPVTVTRHKPDPWLEKSKRWERVDDKPKTAPAAPAGDTKEK